MLYQKDPSRAFRSCAVAHPYSFHVGARVYEGRLLWQEGLGVLCPWGEPNAFDFHRFQTLRTCYIQIEGHTLYFPKLQVVTRQPYQAHWLYRLHILSQLPKEYDAYLALYQTLSPMHAARAQA